MRDTATPTIVAAMLPWAIVQGRLFYYFLATKQWYYSDYSSNNDDSKSVDTLNLSLFGDVKKPSTLIINSIDSQRRIPVDPKAMAIDAIVTQSMGVFGSR